MRVYFVRHGESKQSAEGRHQDDTPGLSELGVEQVKVVARRFENIPVDLIVASRYKRAMESAEIIGKKVKVKVRYSDNFKEAKRPTEMEGRLHGDEVAMEVRR